MSSRRSTSPADRSPAQRRRWCVTHPYDGRRGRPTTSGPRRDQVERGGRGRRRGRATRPRRCPRTSGRPRSTTSRRRLAERADEIARLITAENGKPIKWARGRGGPGGVDVPLGRRGGPPLLRRAAAARHRPGRDRPDRPGPPGAARARCSASRPFNFPLNLVAHKVAPAIAVGAPIVLKPAPATPLSALLLGERSLGRDGPAGGDVLGAAGAQRPRADAGRRPAAAGGLVHRLRARSARRSGPPCRTSTSRWSWAATRRRWSARTGRDGRPGLGGHRGSPRSPTTRPGRAASRCSGSSCTRRSTTGFVPTAGRGGRGAAHRRPDRTRRPRSGR